MASVSIRLRAGEIVEIKELSGINIIYLDSVEAHPAEDCLKIYFSKNLYYAFISPKTSVTLSGEDLLYVEFHLD